MPCSGTVLAGGSVEHLLHFALHRRDGVGVADHLHPASRIRDESVERHHQRIASTARAAETPAINSGSPVTVDIAVEAAG